jgi:hypothetical protein
MFYSYCLECERDEKACPKGECRPCVKELDAAEPHGLQPPGFGVGKKLVAEKGSKVHVCRCWVDSK